MPPTLIGVKAAHTRHLHRRQGALLAVITALALVGLSVRQGPDLAQASPRRLLMQRGAQQHALAAATAAAAAALSAEAQQQPEPQQAAAALGFRHRKVVAISAYDEYAHFTRALEALQQAWGSEQYTLLLYIDHEKPPVPADAAGGGAGMATAAAREASNQRQRRVLEHALQLQAQALARPSDSPVNFQEVRVNLSSTHLGRPLNKKCAAAGAMALTDFAVLLDANVALAPDGLHWFEWHVDSGFIFANPRVGAATCWSPAFPAAGEDSGAGAELAPDAAAAAAAEAAADQLVVRQLGLLDKFLLDGWAQPWGLALWRAPWEGGLGQGWRGQDQQLARQMQRHGWVQSVPLVPRCNLLEGSGDGSSSAKPAGAAVVQRSLTSAAFFPAADLRRCAFAALPRNDTSAPLHDFELFASFVRYGIQPDSRLMDLTLPELAFLMEQHVQRSPAPPAQWRSSC
jgi:hypothetical protein